MSGLGFDISKIMDMAGEYAKKAAEDLAKKGIEKGVQYGIKKLGFENQVQPKFKPAPSYARSYDDSNKDYTNYLVIGGLIIGAILLLRR